MKKRRSRNNEPEDFQMAPMIDMVFLLLVFFMTVASVANNARTVELDLPESEESTVPEDGSGRGVISVDANGKYFIGETQKTLDEAKLAIAARLKAEPELQVQIRADRATEYAAVQKLLRTAAEAGAYEIIYATFEAR